MHASPWLCSLMQEVDEALYRLWPLLLNLAVASSLPFSLSTQKKGLKFNSISSEQAWLAAACMVTSTSKVCGGGKRGVQRRRRPATSLSYPWLGPAWWRSRGHFIFSTLTRSTIHSTNNTTFMAISSACFSYFCVLNFCFFFHFTIIRILRSSFDFSRQIVESQAQFRKVNSH